MQNYFSKNIRALRKRYPSFRLPEIWESPQSPFQLKSDEQFEYCLGLDSQPNLRFQSEGVVGYIHDPSDANGSAKVLTNPVEMHGNGLLVCFGLGFGYEVRELLHKMDKGTNFVIVEPSAEILRIIMEHSDISYIFESPNVHFLLWEDKQRASVFFRPFISSANYKNLATFVIQSYVNLFFEKCRDLFFAVDDIRHIYELEDQTKERFTPIWQKNALSNLRSNLESYFVSDFWNSCKNLPAVVVSAGPSLAKNIQYLKGMEDRVLIISVDTALQALLKQNIRPHFVVTMDGQEIVWRKFRDLDYSDIPLLYLPTANAQVVGHHQGKKLLSLAQDVFYGTQMLALGKNPGYVEMGGSVATAAFSFAQNLGCDPLILIGQDLAYTNMHSHIEGSAFYKPVDPSKLVQPLLLDASTGGQVYSDSKMLAYLVWFQTYAASDTSGRTYIDATEGGAKIEGFKVLPLRDALNKYALSDGVAEHLAHAFQKAPLLSSQEKKAVISAAKGAIAFLDGIAADAKNASEQLGRIVALLQKTPPNHQAVRSAYNRIDPFEKKVARENDKLQLFSIALSPFVEEMNFQFQNAQFASDLEKNIFAAGKYAAYYDLLYRCCNEYLPLARAAVSEKR